MDARTAKGERYIGVESVSVITYLADIVLFLIEAKNGRKYRYAIPEKEFRKLVKDGIRCFPEEYEEGKGR